MRSTLRKFFLTPAVMVAAALTTGAARAATPINVPFSFNVAGKDCPAGRYLVERGLVGDSVLLKSADSSRSFSWILRPGDPAPKDVRVLLTFDEVGDRHILQSVQYGNKVTPRLDRKPSEYVPMRIVMGQ